MIKKILILFMAIYINDGFCGVSVVGTRFMLNDQMHHLNIKVINDNESDYLIKSVLDDMDFIVSPPLFLLPKNSSNLITVIPKEKTQYDKDKILNLTLTAIPRSTLNDDSNAVSLAVRNHFKVIYRHKDLQESAFDKLEIVYENNQCTLSNYSNFVFTVSLSKSKNESHAKLMNLSPDEKVSLEKTNSVSDCESWVNFHNEYNDIIKTIKLTNKS